MLVLGQAIAFVDQQLVRLRENILIAEDVAEFFNKRFVRLKLLVSCGHG